MKVVFRPFFKIIHRKTDTEKFVSKNFSIEKLKVIFALIGIDLPHSRSFSQQKKIFDCDATQISRKITRVPTLITDHTEIGRYPKNSSFFLAFFIKTILKMVPECHNGQKC